MAVHLSGKEASSDIREELKKEITQCKKDYGDSFCPGLSIVQVGGDEKTCIDLKLKAAAKVGINAQHVKLPEETTEHQLLEKVKELNNDPTVHGIVIHLPLDAVNEIDTHRVTNAIAAEKDVDGLGCENVGKLSRGELDGCILRCFPRGCLELIKKSGKEVKGKRAVVLGQGKLVGSPMADLLKWHHATVITCHAGTQHIPSITLEADILVVAIGKPEFVKGSWIKEGAIVIDCGQNHESGRGVVGDVDFAAAEQVAGFITPVPGGTGPMSIAMLMKHTVDAARKDAEQKAVSD